MLLGSTHDRYATRHFPKATILQYKAPPDVALAVKSGKVDAALYARETLPEVLRADPDLGLLSDTLEDIPIGVGFSKDNQQLRQQFNNYLAQLRQNGIYADMVERWLTKNDTRMPDIATTGANGTLTVGITSDKGLPFTIVKDGRLIGFDNELAERFAAFLGKKIHYADLEFGSLIAAVATHKVDMVISTIMITEERKKQIDFSDPYYELGTSVFALKKNIVMQPSGATDAVKKLPVSDTHAAGPGMVSSLDDLRDKRIGVLLGSTHDAFATTTYPNATVSRYKSPLDIILAVKAGKVDAALYSYDELLQFFRVDNDLATLGPAISSAPVGMGFHLENTELLTAFNSFLQQCKDSGLNDDMIRRWMKNGETAMPEIAPKPPVNGTLVVGLVSDNGLPFAVVKDGKLIGYSIELLERFAAYAGKKIEFLDMEFSSLIAAAASKKIDMIGAVVAITEERKRQIAFSDPYYQAESYAFALKKNIAEHPPAPDSAAPGPSQPFAAHISSGISRLQDINGKRIAVLTGSAGDLAARRHFPRADFQDMTAPADAALALKTGKVDAFVYDKSVLLNLVRTNPELVILDEAVDTLEVAAALSKANGRLLADVNRVLQELKTAGILQNLRTTWVDTNYTTAPPLPKISTAEAAPPLRMGTFANLEPFSFHSIDGLTGLDIALSRMIGERLGRKIEIVDMNFETLIPALQTGKIDFALANFNVTEERKKLINFSLPYIENDISALVRQSTPLPAVVQERGQNESARTPEGPGRLALFFTGVTDSFQSNILLEKRYLLLWEGLKTTVLISIFATIFGTLLGGLVCGMRMSRKTVFNLPARMYIALLRGTPVLVLLMLIFYVAFASVQISPVVVAVIAFGLNFAAYVAEIYRSGIEGIDKGQTEAGIAMGFTRMSTFLHIILPQTIQRILPVYKGEFISLVKTTSIVGYIAVQDLTKAGDIIRSRTFDAFFPLIMVAILYFSISWLLMQSLDYLERRTDPKLKRTRRATA